MRISGTFRSIQKGLSGGGLQMAESNERDSVTSTDLNESQLAGLDEGQRLEYQMEKIQTELKTLAWAKLRPPDFVSLGIAALGVLWALFGRFLLGTAGWESSGAARYTPLIGIGVAVYGLGLLAVSRIGRSSRAASLRADLDTLEARRRVASQLGGVGAQVMPLAQDTYFDRLVRINVENLAAYYALVKEHTEKSFLTASAVGVIGFLLVITGLIVGFVAKADVRAVSYIASASGIIVEFIAGVFFYLYNRTVREMKGYHTSLLTVQNILLAFKLVGDTEGTEKAKMMGQMMSYLTGNRAESPMTNNERNL
jgi:hypothetical protein